MKRPIIIVIIITLAIGIPYINNSYKRFCDKVTDEITIDAIVVTNKEKKEYYNSYKIKGINEKYKNKYFILYTKKVLEYGDKIFIKGNFYKPDEERNYKGFNYKKYLQTKKIYGTIKSNNIEIRSKNNINVLFIFFNKVKIKIINNIEEILPEKTSGLLTGIILGEKSSLDHDIYLNFQKSSLAHVLAVSGAHISYIILGITYFFEFRKVHKKIGYFLTIFILVFFLFLTNFSPSVIRASIMSIIVLISKIIHRKADFVNTILIALFISLINNPYSIKDVGLELSYLGTIGIVYFAPIIEKQIIKHKFNKKIVKIVSVPISAQILILPIMIINFHTISFNFLCANIIAMPILGAIIILGFITIIISFVSMWLAKIVGTILNVILESIITITKLFGSLSFSNIYVRTPSFWSIFIFYFFIIVLFLGAYLKEGKIQPSLKILFIRYLKNIKIKKIIVYILTFILLIEFPYQNFNGKLKIFFIDVGQRRLHTCYKSLWKENFDRWRRTRAEYINSIFTCKKNKNN